MILENNENNQQPQKNQFQLQLGISTNYFTHKPTPTEIRRIQFRKESITVNEMVNLIKGGYCFSHCFNTQQQTFGLHEKTINNFDYTNYLWIDIDKSACSLESFFNQLKHKPTLAYTTLSNSVNNYRYRLIYLLDFRITINEEYRRYLNVFVNDIVNDLGNDFIRFIDRKCFNVSSMMFGSKMDCTLIQNQELIYTNQMIEQIESKLKSNQSIFKFKDLTGLNELKCSKVFNLNKEEERDVIDGNRKDTTRELCNRVLENYKNGFNYSIYLTNRENINNVSEDLYIDVSNQYIYESNIYFKNKSKIPKGNRRRILYRNAIIIRNITPDIDTITLATVLYCLYKYHCETSYEFGVLDVCYISQGVMTLNPEDEQFRDTGRRKYLFNKDHYSSIDISREDKIKELAKCKRRKRDTFLQKNYDWNKSVLDNAKSLNIAKSTIYNFLNENNHSLNRDIKYIEFVELYNQNPQIRSVRKLAKLTGLSDKTVQKYKRRIENEEKNVSNLSKLRSKKL